MTKPVTIPNTFASATSTIPLSQLDTNFSTISASLNDPATYASYAADIGVENAYVVNLNPAPSSLSSIVGLIVTFQPTYTNTGSATLNLNALGVINIVNYDSTALSANQIQAGSIVALSYNGTNFILVGSGGTGAVAGWKGPVKAHQDFQFESGAIEVKTTLAKQPQVVRITSERQLDDNNWPALFMYVLALDVRQDGGETLVSMVATLRKSLTGDAVAQEQFEDALLAVGYLDNHAELYADRGYVIRSQKAFRVKNGFPRLLEKHLPTGIGDVNYGLAVGACEPFNVNFETVVAAIKPVLIIDVGGNISV